MSKSQPQSQPQAQAELSPLERAKRAAAIKGNKSNLGSTVVNAEPGWHYYTFSLPGETRRAEDMRNMLHDRGFEPVNGPRYQGAPRREFVAGQHDAEIWRCTQEVAAFWHAQRLEANLARPGWAKLQAGRVRGDSFVPSLT